MTANDSFVPTSELEHLQAKIRKLADEKAYLQLMIRLIEQINPLPEINDMVSSLLQSIMETIGGTNIKLYYWIEDQLQYADFTGERKCLTTIDDPLVASVIDSRKFLAQRTETDDGLLQGLQCPAAWLWIFPLTVSESLIGVIKIENLNCPAEQLREYLPSFFSHAALILSNEIRSYSRRKAEEALRQKKEELDNYFNNALDLFCIADTKGHFHKLNPAWQQTLGYELSDLFKHRFMDLVHPDDREVTMKAISKLSHLHPILNLTNRYQHKDGTYRWIEWRSKSNGNLIFAAARDITEQKNAEEKIQKWNQELEIRVTQRTEYLLQAIKFNQTILLNSPLSMGVYAATGQCILANEAYAQLVGAKRDSLLGQNFHNIAAWKESGLIEDCLTALAHHSPQQREIHVTSSYGKEVWLDCRILPTLINSKTHLLIQFFDLSERKRNEEQLRQYAFHDPLTHLPNRRLLLDHLQLELNTSKRQNSYLAVLFIDLNKFKQLNDTHGHESGDMLLLEVANRLQQTVRDIDTVARFGGDEFVVLLGGLGASANQASANANTVANKIRQILSKEYLLGDLHYQASASVGIKLFLGNDDGDPEQIIKEADTAMYEEKKRTAQ